MGGGHQEDRCCLLQEEVPRRLWSVRVLWILPYRQQLVHSIWFLLFFFENYWIDDVIKHETTTYPSLTITTPVDVKTRKECRTVTYRNRSKRYCHTMHSYMICKQIVSGGFNCAKITAYTSPQCEFSFIVWYCSWFMIQVFGFGLS